MWKRLLIVTAVSAAMSSMAMAAPLTVGFSQVGSESGWRAAETNVAKSEAGKRGITLINVRAPRMLGAYGFLRQRGRGAQWVRSGWDSSPRLGANREVYTCRRRPG